MKIGQMQHVFQFKISNHGIDDSFMFAYPPTAHDIIEALKAHQAMVNADYSKLHLLIWYDECIEDIPNLPWSDARPTHTGTLAVTMGHINGGSYSFTRHDLIGNGGK